MINLLNLVLIILLVSLFLILYGKMKGKSIASVLLKFLVIPLCLILITPLGLGQEEEFIPILEDPPYSELDPPEIFTPIKETPIFLAPDGLENAGIAIAVSLDRLYNWGIYDDFNETAWQEECDKKWLEMLNQSNITWNLTA